MAKRLTITIPDELAERLELHRDRVNVSRVAAGAIEAVLRDLEAQQALSRTSPKGLVAKMRRSIRGVAAADERQGRSDASFWASRLDEETLLQAAQYLSDVEFPDNYEELGNIGVSLEDVLGLWKDNLEDEIKALVLQGEITNRDAYLLGWYKGMQDILLEAYDEASESMDKSDDEEGE